MKNFWKYQVRYRAAKFLLDVGLWLMPEGRYKSDLLDALWTLRAKVQATNDAHYGKRDGVGILS